MTNIVKYRYNAVHDLIYCSTVLRQNINCSLFSGKTPHTSHERASYRVSIVGILEKINRVIASPHCISHCWILIWLAFRSMTLLQYPKRRIIVRPREVSKPRDLYLELYDRSEIWHAHRQQCCRCACQILRRCDDLNYQSLGFEISQDHVCISFRYIL